MAATLKKSRAPPAAVREVSSCLAPPPPPSPAACRHRWLCSRLFHHPRSSHALLAPPSQVRAVAVCRPPVANDRRRLSAAPGEPLQELDILQPDEALPAGAPDASLCRDISVEREGRGAVLRLPLYGYRGGADLEQLCEREVAPLLQRLLAGESCAVIAYGQTGALGRRRAGCLPPPRSHAYWHRCRPPNGHIPRALHVPSRPCCHAPCLQARARATPWAQSATKMGRRRSRTRVGDSWTARAVQRAWMQSGACLSGSSLPSRCLPLGSSFSCCLPERPRAPPAAVGAFCCRRVFELAREEGVRGLEVSFAAVEVRRASCLMSGEEALQWVLNLV